MNRFRTAVFALIFVLSLVFPCILLADNVRWQWNDIDAEFYRWQLGGESEDGWNVVQGNVHFADTLNLDPSSIHHFYIQSSMDGNTWTSSTMETWGGDDSIASEQEIIDVTGKQKKNRFGFRTSLSPYSLAIFDFYNGHDVEGAKFLTMTDYSTSFDAELFWEPPWPIQLHLDAGYVFALKSETILPKAIDVHYVRIGGGLDFLISNEKLSFAFGVLGGELMTFNADHWNPGSYLGGRLLLEFNLTENLLLGVQSKAAASYQKASEPLLSSITWMIDPVTLSFSYRF